MGKAVPTQSVYKLHASSALIIHPSPRTRAQSAGWLGGPRHLDNTGPTSPWPMLFVRADPLLQIILGEPPYSPLLIVACIFVLWFNLAISNADDEGCRVEAWPNAGKLRNSIKPRFN